MAKAQGQEALCGKKRSEGAEGVTEAGNIQAIGGGAASVIIRLSNTPTPSKTPSRIPQAIAEPSADLGPPAEPRHENGPERKRNRERTSESQASTGQEAR